MTVMANLQIAPLACQGLGLQLGGRSVLRDIDLAAIQGETLAIVGPNGSGKSSLLKLLAGLRKPGSGRVDLLGEPLAQLPRRRIAQALALVEQQADTADAISVYDAVALGRTPGCRPWRRSPARTVPSSSRPWPTLTRCTCARACGIRFQVENASVCTLPAPWPNARRCYCSTSQPTTWTSSTS